MLFLKKKKSFNNFGHYLSKNFLEEALKKCGNEILE